jgi:rhodanese/phosphatase family protein
MANEPFQIYQLAGIRAGTLGLCRQPSIDADFEIIDSWRPNIVLTLTGKEEFPTVGKSLPQQFQEAGYDWLHIPITDFGVPANEDTSLWHETLVQLHETLSTGGKVLIHCKGGKGRSGMVLLKLLVMQGEAGEAALARLRAVREGAVETKDQYKWATMPL